MSTTAIYDELLAQVTDELERQVLQVLIERAGTKTSRPDMVYLTVAYPFYFALSHRPSLDVPSRQSACR